MITSLDSKRLSGPAYLDTAAAALCTGATGKTTLVHNILLHNSSGAAGTTYIIYLVPSGGTAGASNQIFEGSLDVFETVMISFGAEGLVITDGDSIQGMATAASSIVATICGAEVS